MPPPPPISRVRVPIILLFFIAAAAVSSDDSYAAHCSATVAAASPAAAIPDSMAAFQLTNGYFAGGGDLLGEFPFSRFFYFVPKSLTLTDTPGILHLTGTLVLRGSSGYLPRGRHLLNRHPRFFRPFRPHLPRIPLPRGKASFEVAGFFAQEKGMICMVGTGSGLSSGGNNSLDLNAVFKINYPNSSTINSSVASGVLEVFDNAGSTKSSLVSVMVYAQMNYEYSKISEAEGLCSRVEENEVKLGFTNSSLCTYLSQRIARMRFGLENGRNCSGRSCGPFGFSPAFMSMNQIQCLGDGRLRMFMEFSNVSSSYKNFGVPVPGRTLVGEGIWDEKRSRLCLVACRVEEGGDPLVRWPIGDCKIGISFWLPAVHTIESRSTVVGRIWSNRDGTDLAYFDTVAFSSIQRNPEALPGSRYEYKKLDIVNKSCVQESSWKLWKEKYPDGNSFVDMKFVMNVRDSKGGLLWGRALPFSVGDKLYDYSYTWRPTPVLEPEHGSTLTNNNLRNISYRIFYNVPNASTGEIAAEGLYNAETGLLCMVGCQLRDSNVTEQVKPGYAMDCAIRITMQFSPLNSKAREHLTGKIISTREKLDPGFFEPLEVVSYGLYTTQAAESLSRMDIEITMVLISLTLSCIFIGLQLFYIKKNPHVLPSISITMLVVLTLGHMIPLVLNIEALFFIKRNRQNVLLQSGGWLEANEVVVRIITMAAFLLQFRLLQVAFSARSNEENREVFWTAERKSSLFCFPVYIVVGLILWFNHSRTDEPQNVVSRRYIASKHHSLWDDMISYAGFILDGFLLPQVILNMVLKTKDKALAPSFYIGTTIVRALPHVYDAYRAHYYAPRLKSSFIYASPNGDLYSSAWDIIIPFEGVIFAGLIFVQQKFGGACCLPQKSRQSAEYEMVPVVSQ